MSDVWNKFGVAACSTGLVFLWPIPRDLSRDEALLLAAYLVAMADESEDHARFRELLRAVENT